MRRSITSSRRFASLRGPAEPDLSIAIALGLLGSNAALLLLEDPADRDVAPPPPAFAGTDNIDISSSITVSDWSCVPPTDELGDLRHETLALAQAWRARHACDPTPPACTQPDPVSILYANVDAQGDHERVIGNRRFGVAMFTSSGDLLATMEPVGCAAWPSSVGDQSLSVGTLNVRGTPHAQLLVRTRTFGHCGEMLDGSVVERRGSELVTIAELDLGGERGCNDREAQITTHVSGGYNNSLKVHYHGRMRTHDGPWVGIDDHCIVDFAVTPTSSCRTPAAARTSESE